MHLFECYRVLGLPRNAALDDVKTAYRRLARKYHPDINKDDPTAADKFRIVQEAYQLLKNADGKHASNSSDRQSPQAGVKVKTTYQNNGSPKTNNSTSSKNTARHSHQSASSGNPRPRQSAQSSPPRSTPPPPPQEPKKTTKERQAQWFAKAAQRKYRKSTTGTKSSDRNQAGHNNHNIDPQVKLKSDSLKRLQDLLKQKKYVVAIAVAEGIRQKFPTSPEVIHWQAVAYHRWGSDLLMQGDFKKAELYLNKAATTDPRNRELCFEVKRDLERIARHQSQGEA
jgi:curved DNA-binding protein CbpA